MTKTKTSDFSGRKVVTLENRQSEIINQHIERLGGVPMSAPSMQEIPLENSPEAFLFAEKLFAGEVDIVIFMTGVGTRFLFDILKKRFLMKDIVDALCLTCVVARGPKSVKVLKEFRIPVTITVPSPNTWREILEILETHEKGVSLKGKTIAIQEYGESNDQLIAKLKKLGAHVIQVPVYRWALPDDTTPLLNAIHAMCNNEAQILMVTSANQIKNLMKVASAQGLEANFRKASKNLLIASIGPTTSEALQDCGLSVDFEPFHSKMGHLVAETAEKYDEIMAAKNNLTPSIRVNSSTISSPIDDRQVRRQSPFIKACYREEVPYTPIWLMRQAGRYMKEYNAIRSKVSFLELCKRSELAAEVTVYAAEKIKADAAIIFSDILVVLEPMGLGLEYSAGDGPVITSEIESESDVAKLLPMNSRDTLGYVFDAIKLTRANLKKEIPLIGFCGAPFTLSAYALEGGGSKNFLRTKQFMYSQEKAWHLLMNKITTGLIEYMSAQYEAGTDCLQIFDSWVGCLSPLEYERYVMPHSKRLIDSLPKTVPVIHFGTNTSGFLDLIRKAGGDVIGVDFRVDLDKAWNQIGYDRAVQGNLDPALLLAPIPTIQEHAKDILDRVQNRAGHIFNLGHGILPQTPVDHVIALVDMVHEYSRR